jgi:DNA-binding FadR family transcriptional regulator
MPTPTAPPKVAQLVADQLREHILTGRLVDGERLPNETELRRLYDVARPTVREALRLLESAELVTVKRGARGGAVVRRPSVRPLSRSLTDWATLAGGEDVLAAADRVCADETLAAAFGEAVAAALRSIAAQSLPITSAA